MIVDQPMYRSMLLRTALVLPLLGAAHCGAPPSGAAAPMGTGATADQLAPATPPLPAGSLETVMDLLTGFEGDVSRERALDAEDERVRALACDRSAAALREDIARVARAAGALVAPGDYAALDAALSGAVHNARDHFLNASTWSEATADVYLSTGKALEAANVELQDMEATHDTVVDALKALSKRVKAHKSDKLDHREKQKQRGPVVTGHAAHAAVALIEVALGRAAAGAMSALELRRVLQLAPEQGWHDKVVALTSSVVESVVSSKDVRTQPLRAAVDKLAARYAREGREMKAALRAKSLSKDALLEAKRSKGTIEEHEEETAQKRLQLANATATAREELKQVSARCEHAHQEWATMDASNEESLDTLHDFVGDVASQKKVQDVKLERAVEMMNTRR